MNPERTGGRGASDSPRVFESGSNLDPFQVLTAEHALLRLHLARTMEAARRDAGGPEARMALSAFVGGFELHQRREDLVMYPLCERLFGGKDGVACVLRDDHEALRRVMQGLSTGPDTQGPVSVAALDELRSLLEAHFVKEERVLFPQITARLAGRESANLARRLRATTAT